jgi:hypothetical protein
MYSYCTSGKDDMFTRFFEVELVALAGLERHTATMEMIVTDSNTILVTFEGRLASSSSSNNGTLIVIDTDHLLSYLLHFLQQLSLCKALQHNLG